MSQTLLVFLILNGKNEVGKIAISVQCRDREDVLSLTHHALPEKFTCQENCLKIPFAITH